MASLIDRVEKEFIIGAAAEGGTVARVHAAGRTARCRLASPTRDLVRFAPANGEATVFRPFERVSVYFDFRGQAIAFDSRVKRAGHGLFELEWPKDMFRGLARRWPRVSEPKNLELSLLLPDAHLQLSCPTCREYAEVEAPEGPLPVGVDSLDSLLRDFRTRAASIAADCRVTMFKEGRAPQDAAETLAATTGRVVFLPSVLSGLPLADPYPEGRILTKALLEEEEGIVSLAGASPFAAYLARRTEEGLLSSICCPIGYYRYTIGLVRLENDRTRPRCLDFSAVDFAWDFSRRLAYFLKRHGYYRSAQVEEGAKAGSVLDASPTGLRIALGPEDPELKQGSRIELRLRQGGHCIAAKARVARKGPHEKGHFYGLALEGLGQDEEELLSRGLYGDAGGPIDGLGG